MKVDRKTIRQLRIELVIRSDIKQFLKAAVQLAKIMELHLDAVFRQDPAILKAAALPLVQEVCLWTAQEQTTSTLSLSNAMRIQARQTRTLLAQIAGREAVPYSFSSSDRQPANPGDMVLNSSILWAAGRGLSARTEIWPVCVIDNGSKSGQDCLKQAAEFSNKLARPLKIYTLNSDRMTTEQLAKLEQRLVKSSPPETSITFVENIAVWLQDPQNMRCHALFMPADIYAEHSKSDTLEQAPFPVLLAL